MGAALPFIIPAAAMLGGQVIQSNETNRYLRKQDEAAAQSIINQAQKQREADQVVRDQVGALEGSTSGDERAQRLDQYMQVLRRGQRQANSGLEGPVGGATFQADAGAARNAADAAAATTAGLQARIDAPGLQRQGEAFDYGRLATDLNLIGRESQGQSFVDDLRRRQIRRRPGMDLLGGLASGIGASMLGNAALNGVGKAASQTFGNNMDALKGLPGAGARSSYGLPGYGLVGG